MIELKTKIYDNGTFVYAENENGVRYNIIVKSEHDEMDNECAGCLLPPEVPFDPASFEVTNTLTLNPQP